MDHAISEKLCLLFFDMVISLRVSITKYVIYKDNLETTEIYSSYYGITEVRSKYQHLGSAVGSLLQKCYILTVYLHSQMAKEGTNFPLTLL